MRPDRASLLLRWAAVGCLALSCFSPVRAASTCDLFDVLSSWVTPFQRGEELEVPMQDGSIIRGRFVRIGRDLSGRPILYLDRPGEPRPVEVRAQYIDLGDVSSRWETVTVPGLDETVGPYLHAAGARTWLDYFDRSVELGRAKSLGGKSEGAHRLPLPGGAPVVAKELAFPQGATTAEVRRFVERMERWHRENRGVGIVGVGYAKEPAGAPDARPRPGPKTVRVVVLMEDFHAPQTPFGALVESGSGERLGGLTRFSGEARRWLRDRMLACLVDHPDSHAGNSLFRVVEWNGSPLPPAGTYFRETLDGKIYLFQAVAIDAGRGLGARAAHQEPAFLRRHFNEQLALGDDG